MPGQPRKTIWVSQDTNPVSDKPYAVTKTKNTTDPQVGQRLSQQQVDALIARRIDVIVGGSNGTH